MIIYILVGCKSTDQRCLYVNNYIGKIYILESTGGSAFFQFKTNDTLCYYSKGDVGEQNLIVRNRFYKMENDTTMILTISETKKIELIYNSEMDYWFGVEALKVYRRCKKVVLKSFELKEF